MTEQTNLDKLEEAINTALGQANARIKELEAENEKLRYACTVSATAEAIYEGGIMDLDVILVIQETAREALKDTK